MSDHEVVKMILIQLEKEYPNPPVPVDAIDSSVEKWRTVPFYEDLTDADWGLVGKEVKSRVKISMDPGETLRGEDFKDWLQDRADDIKWRRWLAYKQLLTSKGYTPNVLASLDASTDEILNCLGDPTTPGNWKRRGLVIGDVQSGKTATYLGAVNKAADAGYRLVVLLAGGTEALRKQTQFRVDEGFIGRDSSNDQVNGVSATTVFGAGKWHAGGFVAAQGLTTQETDFRKNAKQAINYVLDPHTSTPIVFVMKKNKTALQNLRDWLLMQQVGGVALDIPMLVVDDESDYASVNVNAADGDSPTVINSLIRSVLATVARSSYLAFTATPFANVFIDHETVDDTLGDDLFPRDYIRTLDAPSNYVGSAAYFGTEDKADNGKLISLNDAERFFPIKHKSHHLVKDLPDSLIAAIRTFVVACAIREARGDSSPRSMLVNVSRFKKVQAQVHELVEAEFERIKTAIELHSVSLVAQEHAEIAALRETFVSSYPDTEFKWEDIRVKLRAAVRQTAVKLINSDRVKQAKDLAEVESDRMIAVGGDVLSRGLTLEGLTVSYFHRSVGASDTLLQMARWFGYRAGYGDLCRVWIPDQVADQFRYVAGIVDELRGQLRAMKKRGMTPKDFGLVVRMHPEALLITARNKMRAAEAKAYTIDIAGKKNLETVVIDSDPTTLKNNWSALKALVAEVERARPDEPWRTDNISLPAAAGIDKAVVASFLEAYKPFASDAVLGGSAIASFLSNTRNPKLQSWLVGFVGGSGDSVTISEKLTVAHGVRKVSLVNGSEKAEPVAFRVSGSGSRLAGSSDVGRVSGLPNGNKLTEPTVYEELPYPVLLAYLVTPKTDADETVAAQWAKATSEGAEVLVGYKIGIPGKPGEKGADVKYMLNTVAIQAWQGTAIDDLDDEDAADLDGVDDE